MKGKTVTEVPGKKSSVDQAQHILPALRKIASGKFKPTSLEQERLLDHLTVCTHCQISVEVFVAATLATPLEHPSNDHARKLLISLQDALHKLQVQEEQIAAYAETFEVHGIKEANKRFPAFAEHLKHCEVCKAEVADMRDVLRQVAHAGLIKPLREDVKA